MPNCRICAASAGIAEFWPVKTWARIHLREKHDTALECPGADDSIDVWYGYIAA